MITGILLALLGGVGAGASDVFMRRALTSLPIGVVLIVVMATILITTTSLGLLAMGSDAYLGLPPIFFAGIIAMALLGFVIGQTLHLTGLRKAGVTIVSPVLGTAPLFALLLGVSFGGERPNLPTVIGAFAIVFGVATVLSDSKRTQI